VDIVDRLHGPLGSQSCFDVIHHFVGYQLAHFR